jgi:hypothetical protein
VIGLPRVRDEHSFPFSPNKGCDRRPSKTPGEL